MYIKFILNLKNWFNVIDLTSNMVEKVKIFFDFNKKI